MYDVYLNVFQISWIFVRAQFFEILQKQPRSVNRSHLGRSTNFFSLSNTRNSPISEYYEFAVISPSHHRPFLRVTFHCLHGKITFLTSPFDSAHRLRHFFDRILTGFIVRAERKMAQGCRGGYLSLFPSRIILSRVPVNGPRPICLPCKQTGIGLEVVRLISRINPELKRGGKRGLLLPFLFPLPRSMRCTSVEKNTFSILIKKKYCRGICITKISPRRVFLAPSSPSQPTSIFIAAIGRFEFPVFS